MLLVGAVAKPEPSNYFPYSQFRAVFLPIMRRMFSLRSARVSLSMEDRHAAVFRQGSINDSRNSSFTLPGVSFLRWQSEYFTLRRLAEGYPIKSKSLQTSESPSHANGGGLFVLWHDLRDFVASEGNTRCSQVPATKHGSMYASRNGSFTEPLGMFRRSHSEKSSSTAE